MVIRGWILSAWLTVMSGAAMISGCGATDGGDEPTALYGAPDACSSDEDCVRAHGEGWLCDQSGGTDGATCAQSSDTSGPANTDTAADGDGESAVEDPVAEYGPPPCTTDRQCVEDYGAGWYCAPEGYCSNQAVDGDVDGSDDDEPQVAYGPPPCASDAECVSWLGEGWYCAPGGYCDPIPVTDGDVVENDEPQTEYGPQSCTSDAQCESWYDAGWYCTTYGYCDLKPGGDSDTECEPQVAYGPPPCESDAQCVTDNGAGWYCDQENTANDGCQTFPYPICKPTEGK